MADIKYILHDNQIQFYRMRPVLLLWPHFTVFISDEKNNVLINLIWKCRIVGAFAYIENAVRRIEEKIELKDF